MSAATPLQGRWLADFHAGAPAALERCYRDHFADVFAAVGRVLRGADRESVVHQVFYRVISDPGLRAGFRGGNLAAWLSTVARNEAIDFRRRYAREAPLEAARPTEQDARDPGEATIAKVLLDRFLHERLPPKLVPVFEARFLRQLPQREAAQALGVPRSTLVYQEQQIRDALRAFLLEDL